MTDILRDERTPLLSERLRLSLEHAGPRGRSSHQLALELYGENSYSVRCRVHQLVGTLRWNGVKILMIKDNGFRLGRYVLAEYIITAESKA